MHLWKDEWIPRGNSPFESPEPIHFNVSFAQLFFWILSKFLSTFGEVFSAMDIRTLDKAAIKTMSLADNYEEDLVTEVAMMKTLRHPNIVQYIDSFIVKDKLWVRLYSAIYHLVNLENRFYINSTRRIFVVLFIFCFGLHIIRL